MIDIRYTFSKLARGILGSILKNIQPRTIYEFDGKNAYLSRYYVTGKPTMPEGGLPFDQNGNPKREAIWPDSPFNIYIHKFHRGDNDRELHNHPWKWALSFVFAGGYREERRTWRDEVIVRDVKPFTFNWITQDDFHRVDLVEKDAWTLFIVGPRAQSWGFWDRSTKKFTPWREHLAKRQAEFRQELS